MTTAFATFTLAGVAVLAPQAPQPPPDTAVKLSEIVITGTRSTATARLEQSAALSLLVPRVETRASSAVAVDLLRNLPGVYVQQTSAGQGAVILRGLVGNQVLYLVDGIPLNNGTYRDGPGQYLATIDPEMIERIEVIRGPASVLYGSDAQGGVVNIVTKSHAFVGARSVHLAANGSTANMGYRTRVSGGLTGSRWSFAIGGTVASAKDLRAGEGLGEQEPTGFDAAGLDVEFTYEPNPGHVIKAVGQHFRMDDVPRFDRYVDFRPPAVGQDAEHLFDPQTRQLGYVRYTFTPRYGGLNRLEATASLAIQREGRRRIGLLDSGESDSIRTALRDDVYTPGLSIVGSNEVQLADRIVTLTWGGEVYHDRLDSRGVQEIMTSGAELTIQRVAADGGMIGAGNFPDGAQGERVGLFLAAETYLIPALKVEAGARWSRFRTEADVGTDFGGFVESKASDVTAQVGLVAIPSAAWRLALRLAEGFRAPNLYDLTRVGPVPGGIAVPNPDAIPERSLSVDFGVRHLTHHGAVAVTVYRTRVTNFIDRRPGSFMGDTLFNGERVFQGLNVGTARIVGFEAEALRRFGPLEARAAVLYTKGDQEAWDGVDEAMSKIPPLNGLGALRWNASGSPLWLEYVVRWAVRQDRLGSRDLLDPRIPDGGTTGYLVQGIRAGTELQPRLNLSVGLENLTDELYRTHASGVDGAGRHIWVGVSATGVL
jgi:outer membrane receptor protein involved in Fe transport